MVKKGEKQARTWGMLCHLAALAGFIGIPFGNLLGPLVVWLVKKNEYPIVDEQGKESLNFQITMTICGLAAFTLIFVFIGVPLLFALAIFDLVMVVMASVKINNGESFRYPFSLRLIK